MVRLRQDLQAIFLESFLRLNPLNVFAVKVTSVIARVAEKQRQLIEN
jgi:hypothetical protein